MTTMAEAIDRLAKASEAQVRLLEVQERERELAPYKRQRGYRSELRKIDFLMMVRACPELLEAFARKIPAEFWSLDGNTAEVACPCGATPRAELGGPVGCECDRSYLYDGEDVRVAGGPKGQEVAAPLVD